MHKEEEITICHSLVKGQRSGGQAMSRGAKERARMRETTRPPHEEVVNRPRFQPKP
jgi:hypothetical protein